MSESKEIAVQSPKPRNQVSIYNEMGNPIEAAKVLGEALYDSQIVALQSPEAGMMCALTCFAENITPLQFSRKYHMIGKKPSQAASSMLADFVSAGGKYTIVEASSERVEVKMEFRGRSLPAGTAITWEDMQTSRWPWKNPKDHKEGLKDNWSTPVDRKNQMWARFISENCKMLAPELFYGSYTPEELADVADYEGEIIEKKPTPTPEEAAAKVTTQQAVTVPAGGNADPVLQQTPANDPSISKPHIEVDVSEVANDIQVARVEALMDELQLKPEVREKILHKRNVEKAEHLTPTQADQIIEALEAKIAARTK